MYVTVLSFPTTEGHLPHLNHVTCIAHGLHRVYESISENYNTVNDFIAALKKILVIKRWGTWMRCTVFLCENLTKSNALDSTDAAAIKHIQQLVSNKDLEFSACLLVLA